MKQKVNRWIDLLLGGILSLLGFGSCDNWNPVIDAPVEYGTPHANYKIVGSVTDETGTPIPGIKVKPLFGGWSDNTEEDGRKWAAERGETLNEAYYGVFYTDADGKVNISTDAVGWEAEEDWRIALIDPDGAENGGTFASDTLYRKDISIEKTGEGNGWLTGEYTVSFERKLKKEDAD